LLGVSFKFACKGTTFLSHLQANGEEKRNRGRFSETEAPDAPQEPNIPLVFRRQNPRFSLLIFCEKSFTYLKGCDASLLPPMRRATGGVDREKELRMPVGEPKVTRWQ
jgi:hypothetical protein